MAVQRHEDGKTFDWDISLRDTNDGFQWSIRLDAIIDEEKRIYDVLNRMWMFVGPEFKTRVEGSRFLGFSSGAKDATVSANWDRVTEEYHSHFANEIETRERFNERNKPKFGRPSQGRTERMQFSATSELRAWINAQKKPNENESLVVFRLLEEMRK